MAPLSGVRFHRLISLYSTLLRNHVVQMISSTKSSTRKVTDRPRLAPSVLLPTAISGESSMAAMRKYTAISALRKDRMHAAPPITSVRERSVLADATMVEAA
jgi:hypothetical protein